MNIAVMDTAAESGGALSVLSDYVDYLRNNLNSNKWFIFTNANIIGGNNIYIIKCDFPKKSWIHRLVWDNFKTKLLFKQYKIDCIVSLQNTGFIFTKIPQIVYFHNVLLLENNKKYSLLKKEERLYGLYTTLISRYTKISLKKVNYVISQTETVKRNLEDKWDLSKVVCIKPNVNIPGINDVIKTEEIKGLIYPAAPEKFKNHIEIIKCVKDNYEWFRNRNFDIIFTINGKENETSKFLLSEAKGFDNIRFVGYLSRNNVLELYKKYGLIINSEMESFPIPFIEAMSYGAPIISAKYDYALEILNDYDNKLYFEIHNQKSMFSTIRQVSKCKHSIPKKPTNINTWSLLNQLLSMMEKENEVL